MVILSYLLLSVAAVTGVQAAVPYYVIKYAPVVYLYSGEKYMPSDIGAQVRNTHPTLNYTKLTTGVPSPLNLSNLDQLNNIPNSAGGQNIYLTSTPNPTGLGPGPKYLYGVTPSPNGLTKGAKSCAIVTVENKTAHHLDAFYFYFYAYNYGGDYFQHIVDDHIGDWEHTMVRFNTSLPHPKPTAVWYSQHSSGEAFSYATTSKYKNGLRPINYSANGTHANYATPGNHDHTLGDEGINLPAGPIEDHTDAGVFWDPTLNAYYYSYDPASDTFTAYNGEAPTGWLQFKGRWGDEQYPVGYRGQSCPFGIDAICKYTTGPTGPEDKDLVRTNVCPDSDEHCYVSPVLLPKKR